MKKVKKFIFGGSSRIIIFSFLGIILIGTLILMMPQAVNGERLSFIDAIFTATSATCVTGLIVVDTGARFTHFGQTVIMILIQLGGLGLMTFSTFFVFLVLGKFSISDRDVIQDTLTQSPVKNIASLLKSIFLFTIVIELVGAFFLAMIFSQELSIKNSIFWGLFHSISAFCNAGFSVFPDSFMKYHGNIKVNIVLMFLIVSGGLGFIVLHELKNKFTKKSSAKKSLFSFHSKIVILVTTILIVAGFLLFFIFEFKNILREQTFQNKILISIFQSVTCRTAGFNTVDISLLTNPTLFFMMILMFIGASPGSCGGGIKTTTAGVLGAMLISRFKNREEVNFAYRRLPNEIVSRAISITSFSIVIIATATILLMTTEFSGISHIQNRGGFLESLFEVVSAFGTVGLSTGLTSGLSTIGKVIIIATMFVGRIGPLTLALAIGKKNNPRFKYAEEKVLIG